MKDPHKMTRAELVEYAEHLKRMIRTLQSQIAKLTPK